MKIAYLILAHQFPEQLIRLIDSLDTDDTSFFIHVDRNTGDEIHGNLVNHFRSRDNVFFTKRHYCKWGDYSLVKATLTGLKHLEKSGIPYEYVILLSGQDYPIKSNAAIQAFLQGKKGVSFLEYNTTPYKMMGRVEHWHFRVGRRHYIIPARNMFGSPLVNKIWNPIAERIKWRRKLPGNLKPYFGSQFWCLSREFVDYILEYLENNKAYERFMRFSYISDEFFFQSILLNSPSRHKIINTDLRYKDFSAHNKHPKVLGKQDLDTLIHSDFLFARKFDMNHDVEILDEIDEWINTGNIIQP